MKRLDLRAFAPEDFDDFAELIRDKMSGKFAAYDDQFPTDDDGLRGVLGYFAASDEFFAIELFSENKVIGFISLNKIDETARNVGFCVHSAYQNMGYATEALADIIRFARDELHLRKLVSGTADVNIPSVKLLEKFGFVKVSASVGSFARSADGKPIEFIGGSYEKRL